MDIKYNKNKSVTINATSDEYTILCAAVAHACNRCDEKSVNKFYKPIMDDINKAYNEQVLNGGL